MNKLTNLKKLAVSNKTALKNASGALAGTVVTSALTSLFFIVCDFRDTKPVRLEKLPEFGKHYYEMEEVTMDAIRRDRFHNFLDHLKNKGGK